MLVTIFYRVALVIQTVIPLLLIFSPRPRAAPATRVSERCKSKAFMALRLYVCQCLGAGDMCRARLATAYIDLYTL